MGKGGELLEEFQYGKSWGLVVFILKGRGLTLKNAWGI